MPSDIQTASETVTHLLHAIDTLDWNRVRATFADNVAIDYTSVFGGEPETLEADALVGRWKELLPGFDATLHITGPVLATALGEREVRCVTAVRGYHHFVDGEERNTWMVAGKYDITLTKKADAAWVIRRLTLIVFYEEGDRELVIRASKRAEARAGGRLTSSI